MDWSVKEEFMAQAIGYEVMGQLKQEGWLESISQGAEIKAVEALEEIRRILDDERLTDPACFRSIEAIVKVLESRGIYTGRHN